MFLSVFVEAGERISRIGWKEKNPIGLSRREGGKVLQLPQGLMSSRSWGAGNQSDLSYSTDSKYASCVMVSNVVLLSWELGSKGSEKKS